MEEPGKDNIIEFIKSMIMSGFAGSSDEKRSGIPSVVGVKFIVAGGECAPAFSNLAEFLPKYKRALPLEVFESAQGYTLQTELPGGCSEFSVAVADGKLKLTTGKNHEYSAEVPLSDAVDAEHIESRMKNGVLEILCPKQR